MVWSLLAAGAGCGLPRVAPDAEPAGCYVILGVRQTGGSAQDFLFPAFFALDSLPAPAAAVPGRQVRLPRDDLSRRAGSWSWVLASDSVVVHTQTPSQGWRLGLDRASPEWAGRLDGWIGDTLSSWQVTGRRVDCPSGLVPAQQ